MVFLLYSMVGICLEIFIFKRCLVQGRGSAEVDGVEMQTRSIPSWYGMQGGEESRIILH